MHFYHEKEEFMCVVAMNAEGARRFFGAPPDCLVEDTGPTEDKRYRKGARCFRVHPDRKQGDE